MMSCDSCFIIWKEKLHKEAKPSHTMQKMSHLISELVYNGVCFYLQSL